MVVQISPYYPWYGYKLQRHKVNICISAMCMSCSMISSPLVTESWWNRSWSPRISASTDWCSTTVSSCWAQLQCSPGTLGTLRRCWVSVIMITRRTILGSVSLMPLCHTDWLTLALLELLIEPKRTERLDLAFNNVKPKDWFFVLD